MPLRATAAATSLGLVPGSIETSATGCVKVLGAQSHHAPAPPASKTISNRAPNQTQYFVTFGSQITY
jgi:hypothetical protein